MAQRVGFVVTFRLVGAGKFGVVGGRVCLFPVTVASWARVSAQPLPSGGDVCLAGLGSGFGGQVGARGGWEMNRRLEHRMTPTT